MNILWAPLRLTLIATVLGVGYVLAAMAILFPKLLWVYGAVFLFLLVRRGGRAYSAFGTARWSNSKDVQNFTEGNGIILGTFLGERGMVLFDATKLLFRLKERSNRAVRRFIAACQRRKKPLLICLNNAVHTAAFAPTSVGKTVSITIPFVLTCRDAMFVADLKSGELVRATAAARKRMGHLIVVLDFDDAVGGRDTFNPIFDIDPASDHAPSECADVAAMLVVETGKETDAFWNTAAKAEIALAIAMVVLFSEPETKNLQTVRKLLADQARFRKMVQACRTSDEWEGILARWCNQSAALTDKVLASVTAVVHSHTAFLDAIPLLRGTARNSFDPTGLLRGNTTVYFVTKPERVQPQLLRLVVGSLIRLVVKGGLSDRRVQVVCEEAASLSHMDAIDAAVERYRGYGIRLLLIYQNIGQLRRCFPDGGEQNLLGNVTQVFFGVNDPQTADYVTNRLGDWTQVITSGGTSSGASTSNSPGGGNTSYSHNSNSNWQQGGRKLLQASEIMNLDQRIAITFHPGVRPICTWLVRHYEPGWMPREMGFLKAAFDTLCLFLTVAMLAVLATGAFILGTTK
jgi:type IV secretion system protein VirD4